MKQRYLANEEITLSTAVEISSLKQDSYIRFSCNVTKDFPPDKTITVNPSEPVKIFKNERKIFDVVCRVPGNAFTIPTDREVLEKKVKLNANYDFKTNSYLDIYTMQKSYLNDLINRGINPFEKEINPSLNKITGQTTPITTYGPMKLILRLDHTQPLTEEGPFTNDRTYNLGLRVQKTSVEWIGRLNEINNVYIYLPKNFELIDESFVEESITNEEEQVFRKYKLNQEYINNINNQCKIYNLIGQKCDDLYDRGFIITLTKFRVNGLDNPALTRDYIRAEIEYIFQAEALTSVTLIKSLA